MTNKKNVHLPDMRVISVPPARLPVSIKEDTPANQQEKPVYIEKRSKRLQLLLQPSLYAQVKNMAKDEGYSVNDLIHRLLEQAVNADERSIYDERI